MAKKSAPKQAPRKAPVKQVAKPKATPREAETRPQREAAEQAAFDQGRTARLHAITKLEPPHGAGPLRDAWVEGWEYQDENG